MMKTVRVNHAKDRPARSDMRDVKINTAQRKLCVSCLQLNNIISVL